MPKQEKPLADLIAVCRTLFLFVCGCAIISLPALAQRVIATIPVGPSPGPLAVNRVTNKIFVATADYYTYTMTVIDGATNSATSVIVGLTAYAVAVDSTRNKIYVVGTNPGGTGSATIIDGATLSTTTLPVGPGAGHVAVDTATNKIYVVNSGDATVTVIDGATLAITTVTLANGSDPTSIAVNTVTNKIYVVDSNASSVTVIDGATLSTATVSVGENPTALAINQLTNKIFVVNNKYGYGNTVSVIDGATLSTSTVTVAAGPWDLAVNEATNQIYVSQAREPGVLTVIDGVTLSTFTVPAGSGPYKLAVDEARNKIYVTNAGGGKNTVTVIDGISYSSTTVGVGLFPVAVAVDSLTNRAYVSDQSFVTPTVSVIGWPGEIMYDAALKVPKCDLPFRSCDSGPTLLLGKDHMAGGAEPNQPNTIHNSCADGTAGTFHVDESIDRLLVASTNGLTMTQGSIVRVSATVWVADPAQDALDLYYATDANNPAWVLVGTLAPQTAGAQTLTALLRLRPGQLQAVRANFRKGGTRSSCSTGQYDDHDDLAFAVR